MIKNKRDKIHYWTKECNAINLDPEEIDKETKAMKRLTMTLKIRFNEYARKDQDKYKNTLNILQGVEKDILEFEKQIPLTTVFSNKGLKDRHWD